MPSRHEWLAFTASPKQSPSPTSPPAGPSPDAIAPGGGAVIVQVHPPDGEPGGGEAGPDARQSRAESAQPPPAAADPARRPEAPAPRMPPEPDFTPAPVYMRQGPPAAAVFVTGLQAAASLRR